MRTIHTFSWKNRIFERGSKSPFLGFPRDGIFFPKFFFGSFLELIEEEILELDNQLSEGSQHYVGSLLGFMSDISVTGVSDDEELMSLMNESILKCIDDKNKE